MEKDIQKYIKCMEEIKLRYISIEHVLKNKSEDKTPLTGHPITDIEFLCLQFRKVLELIAMSSLAANRKKYCEIREQFQKDWKAEMILRDIEKINPNFYPQPCIPVHDRATDRLVELVSKKDGYLTRKEFSTVYGECSKALHASNPYGVSIENMPIQEWFDNFEDWHKKIKELLTLHTIQLIDSEKQLWVWMSRTEDGKVLVQEMEKTKK